MNLFRLHFHFLPTHHALLFQPLPKFPPFLQLNFSTSIVLYNNRHPHAHTPSSQSTQLCHPLNILKIIKMSTGDKFKLVWAILDQYKEEGQFKGLKWPAIAEKLGIDRPGTAQYVSFSIPEASHLLSHRTNMPIYLESAGTVSKRSSSRENSGTNPLLKPRLKRARRPLMLRTPLLQRKPQKLSPRLSLRMRRPK